MNKLGKKILTLQKFFIKHYCLAVVTQDAVKRKENTEKPVKNAYDIDVMFIVTLCLLLLAFQRGTCWRGVSWRRLSSWHFQLLIRHPFLLESNLLTKLVLKFPETFPWFSMKGWKVFIEVILSQALTEERFVSSWELEAGIQRCLNLGIIHGPQAD